jgi:hypothetical protein
MEMAFDKMTNVQLLQVQEKTVVVLGQILTETEFRQKMINVHIKGTVAPTGCPEVSEEVMKQINTTK